MRRRVWPYLFCLVSAALLSVLPLAIFADYATPFTKWEYWYWEGPPAPMPNFRGEELPMLLRAEMALFTALVVPPGFLRDTFMGFPTFYSMPWVSPGSSSEGAAAVPPLALGLEHLTWALPWWSALLVGLYEAAVFARSRRKPTT